MCHVSNTVSQDERTGGKVRAFAEEARVPEFKFPEFMSKRKQAWTHGSVTPVQGGVEKITGVCCSSSWFGERSCLKGIRLRPDILLWFLHITSHTRTYVPIQTCVYILHTLTHTRTYQCF